MQFLAYIFGYLLGSIPTAYIFGKMTRGIDIRQHGSGNVGATNVFRVLGKKQGILVLVLDIFKGIIAVAAIPNMLGLSDQLLVPVICSVCAVCGHNWTIFLQFKGGKGIATSFGSLIGLMMVLPSFRIVVVSALIIWLIFFLFTRYVSLSSIVASVSLPIIMIVTHQPWTLVILGCVFAVFVVVRHRSNIQRLMEGCESKVPLYKKK